jgi:hypothetical protein
MDDFVGIDGRLDGPPSLVHHTAASVTSQSQFLTPENFGAKGDGITDDTAAVQILVNALQGTGHAGYLQNSYRISSPIVITPPGVFRLFGTGRNNLFSSNNMPYILIVTSPQLGTVNHLHLDRIGFQSTNPGSASTEYGIHVTGNGGGMGVSRITNCQFSSLFCGIYSDATGSPGQQNLIAGNVFVTGAKAMSYNMLFTGANFGGTIYSHNVCGATIACIKAGNGADDVGDMVISANEFNGNSGIQLTGGTAYGANVRITGNQFNGTIPSIFLNNMSAVSAKDNTWDGSISIVNSHGFGTTAPPGIFIDRTTILTTAVGSVNDFTAAGMTICGSIVFTAPGDLTGIQSMPEARTLTLINASGGNRVLRASSGGSAPLNRFNLPGDYALAPGLQVDVRYNEITGQWNLK